MVLVQYVLVHRFSNAFASLLREEYLYSSVHRMIFYDASSLGNAILAVFSEIKAMLRVGVFIMG